MDELRSKRADSGVWPNRYEREAFELLRAALIYQEDAINNFSKKGFHNAIRDHKQLRPSADELRARMDFASASFRLPTALARIIKVRRSLTKPFPELWNEDRLDWKRAQAWKHFSRVKRLGCYDENHKPLGIEPDNRLKNALVISLVHRDDFGHGESGIVTKAMRKKRKKNGFLKYLRRREKVLDQLHPCRIIEAQQALVEWALDSLLKGRRRSDS